MSCIIETNSPLFKSILDKTNTYREAIEEYKKLREDGVSQDTYLEKEGIKYQLQPEDEAFYMSQLDNPNITKKQKETAEKLLDMQNDVTYKDGVYTHTNGKEFERVSNVIGESNGPNGEEGYYGFDGETSKFKDNRAWGNQIDEVLSAVITGKSLEDAQAIVDREVATNTEGSDAKVAGSTVKQLYEIFTNFVNQFPDSIILTQQILYNEEMEICGTADVILVNPDGDITIVDLKSSVNPTNGDYTKITSSGKEITNNYNKRFVKDGKRRASKRERHVAQTSLYKGLAQSKGFSLYNQTDTFVLPIHITNITGNEVNEVALEPMIKLNPNRNFIEIVDKDSVSEYDSNMQAKQFSFYDKILKILQDRVDILRKQGKNSTFVKNLLDNISKLEREKGLATFVNTAHIHFLGNGKNWPGVKSIVEETLEKVTKGVYTDHAKTIETLKGYNDIAELYNPKNNSIMRDLLLFYEDMQKSGIEIEEDSPAAKIGETLLAIQSVQSRFQDAMPDLVARELVKTVDPKLVKTTQDEINRLEKRLAKYKKEKKKESRLKALQERIDNLKLDIGMDKDGNINLHGKIARELKSGGYKDIGTVDMWTTPAISQNNTIVASLAKLIKHKFENVRQKLREFHHVAKAAFDEYAKGKSGTPSQVNKGLYETIKMFSGFDENGNATYKEYQSFVQPINVTAYEEARATMLKETEGKADQSNLRRKWYTDNQQNRPDADIKVGGVSIIKGRNTILKEKYEELKKVSKHELDERFKKWQNSIDGKKTLRMPSMTRYGNDAFTVMQNNPAMKKYYSFLMETYMDSQRRMPERHSLFHTFVLPSISKSSNDRLRENGIKNYLGYKLKDATQLMAEDNETIGEGLGSNLKVVPMMYNQYMPSDDVSLDLISSVLRYKEAAMRYEAQSEIAPLADSTVALTKNTQPVATTSRGVRIIDSAAKRLGLKGFAQYKAKHDGNNVAALLEGFIDMQIYGRHKIAREFTVFGKTLDANKIAGAMMSFASKTQLTFNPLLSVANSLQANVMAMVESTAGEYFNKKNWASSVKEYHSNEMSFIKDSMAGVKKSKLGQLADLYDAIQGDFVDKFGRQISKSNLKKMWSWDTAFYMQHKGEHQVQVTTMIAHLKNIKVKDKTGKEISLYDAYVLDKSGKIKLQEGVDISGLGQLSENGLMPLAAQDRLHAINKRMHGVYNNFDKPLVERHWWGSLMMMYRKWVVPGFKKRWKQEGLDYELGTVTEGTYSTFFRTMVNQTKDLLTTISPFSKDSENLTPREIANVKRAATEYAFIMLTGIMVITLKAMMEAADDDEKKIYAYPLYWSMRLSAELGFYGGIGDPNSMFLPNIKDTMRTFKTPTVTTTLLEKVSRFVSQLTDPYGGYEKATGPYEKGDSKLVAKGLKIFGYSGNTIHPEQAIKILEMQQ